MALYLYVSPEPAQATIQSALAYTRDDHYKPIPATRCGHAFSHGMVRRLDGKLGGLDQTIPDFDFDEGRRRQHLRAD